MNLAPQKGTLPVLQYCRPSQLAVDPTYQRELDAASRSLIQRIARGWDWNLFQPLVVARRPDNSLWVVDGQHRLEAARIRNDVDQLPCVIFHPADPTDEAAVFVELNQARRPLTPFALYNAAIAAGDPLAVALEGLLRDAGLSFAGAADVAILKPGQINIVGRVRRWHKTHGDVATRAALTALGRIVRAHGPKNAGVMFIAIAAVVIQHGDRLSRHLFADVLDRPTAEWITDFHARAASAGIGLEAAAMAVVTEAYAEAAGEAGDEGDDA